MLFVTPLSLPSLMRFENFFVTSSPQHHFSIGVDLVAARTAVAEAAATTLLGLLLDDVDDVDGDRTVLKPQVSNHAPPHRQVPGRGAVDRADLRQGV